ncbi:hypothetical protein FACS1894190_05510 [Spirochaetia bacterium]|nr:hypothetical protein FACS1894190_05510 [Spirochaetia bacterium]
MFAACFPLFADDTQAVQNPQTEKNPLNFIGRTLKEIITSYGAPDSVYAVRGRETWQDDVVFEYKGVDFYLYKDHVWQVGINKTAAISVGDPKAAVLLVLGESAEDRGSYILNNAAGTTWVLQWRYNINSNGKVSSIYLYRTDY